MKIYVSVDMEGIAGIVLPSQLRQGEPHYTEGRRLLTDEVNTVVENLVQKGATEIIVKDAHATGYNLLIDQLHPDAKYFLGAARIEQRFPGLDRSFDGAILIGYHAMAETEAAVRDHSYSSRSYAGLELNGMPIGEIGIDSLLFGLQDVPVLLVTGDDKTCLEAQEHVKGVTTYATKTAFGRHCALIKAPRKVKEELGHVIDSALRNRSGCIPKKQQGPYELTVHYLSTDLADAKYCDGKETVRLDGVRIRYTGSDLLHVLAKAL